MVMPLLAQAQNLQGVVTSSATGAAMGLVSVINIRTQQAAATGQDGLYSIPAKEGDVIVFAFPGYTTLRKVKPPSVLIATMNISMAPLSYQLDEFVLHPYNWTQYQIDSAERQAIYKLPLQRRPPNPIVSPVSAIAELFSKSAKRVYAFQKVFAAGEIEKFVDTRYTTSLVTQLTGLTGDSIGHFMYAHPMPYDFARTATDLELKMWIRASFKEWIKKEELAAAATPPVK